MDLSSVLVTKSQAARSFPWIGPSHSTRVKLSVFIRGGLGEVSLDKALHSGSTTIRDGEGVLWCKGGWGANRTGMQMPYCSSLLFFLLFVYWEAWMVSRDGGDGEGRFVWTANCILVESYSAYIESDFGIWGRASLCHTDRQKRARKNQMIKSLG